MKGLCVMFSVSHGKKYSLGKEPWKVHRRRSLFSCQFLQILSWILTSTPNPPWSGARIGEGQPHPFHHVFHILTSLYLFILRERERAREWWRAEREGDRESQAGSVLSAHEPNVGLELTLWDHDLRWNQESDAHSAEPPWRPHILISKSVHSFLISIKILPSKWSSVLYPIS